MNNKAASKTIALSVAFWIIFILLLVVSGFLSNSFLPARMSKFGYGILGSFVAMFVTWFFLKLGKKSFRDIGLVWESKTLFRFLLGMLIGSLIFGVIILALIIFSNVTFNLNPESFGIAMLIPYLVFIPLALMEEIGFRAYTFVNLNKSVGLILTQVVVAIAFALYHIAYGWTFETAFMGTFVWAWVFGLGAAWSGGIALPTGLHVAVNVLQGLTGLKPGNNSIWIVSFDVAAQETILAGADRVGLIMQGLILVTAIMLTVFYTHKQSVVR